MRSRALNSGLLSAAFLLPGCVNPFSPSNRDGEQSASLTASVGQGPSRKACVSFQGNGVYFSSHIGTLIALLENNIEPVAASGGSSGAIIAGVARSLALNPSLQKNGRFATQDSALVLAASAPIIESTLFLPRLTTPFLLLDALDVFLTGSSRGVLRADPQDGMVNHESIVGQSALVVEFYRSADFRSVLNQPNYTEREREIKRLWKSFVNALDVTPEQVADALLQDRETLLEQNNAHLVAIQDRIFQLFRSKNDTFLNDYREQQKNWNAILKSKGKTFGFDSQERRHAAFQMLLDKVKTFESFDALAATLSGDFMLPDPARVYRAFQGVDSRTSAQLQIPTQTIFHSTARKAALINDQWKEDLGLSSLHQVYSTHATHAETFRGILQDPARNPLKPSGANLPAVVPSDRILVTNQSLGDALTTTISETTAFLRSPIALDAAARSRLNWLDATHELIGYGGWLESNSLGTLKNFDACAPDKVDLFVHTTDGIGMSPFAKMALAGLAVDIPLRGLLTSTLGDPNDIRTLISGNSSGSNAHLGADNAEIKGAIASMEQVLKDNLSLKGRLGHITVSFDNVHPLGKSGGHIGQSNEFIRANRRAMILASYAFTNQVMAAQNLLGPKLKLWNVTGDQITILKATHPEDIAAEVQRVFPR